MKDKFEAKIYLLAIPALIVWEVLFQLVIVRLFPAAADNNLIHGGGFVLLVCVIWVIAKRRTDGEDEDGGPGF